MQRAADISGFYKGTALPLRDNLMTRENEMAGIDASIRRAIKEDRLHPRCKADLDRLSLANASMPDSDIWLDVRAVELYFQVDRRRVYRLIESGRLPSTSRPPASLSQAPSGGVSCRMAAVSCQFVSGATSTL